VAVAMAWMGWHTTISRRLKMQIISVHGFISDLLLFEIISAREYEK
jgi:hypothetical protein